MDKHNWTFLTNHGHVLIYLARNPKATTRQIAIETGVTERAIQKVIADLEAEGYIVRQKEGRSNNYTLHPELPMRHSLEKDHAVCDLIKALGDLI